MDWSTVRNPSATKTAAPRVDLVEARWRAVGPTGKPLTCGVFRTAAGLEVRVSYSDDDLLRSQMVRTLEAGRALADDWRAVVLAKGFTDVPA